MREHMSLGFCWEGRSGSDKHGDLPIQPGQGVACSKVT